MISKAKYALLVASAAQLQAGKGKNPTPAQIVFAKRKVDRHLRAPSSRLPASSSLGSWSSWWRKVKNLATSAARAAVRAAPAAGRFAKKSAPIILPVAAGAIASPFLIKLIQSVSKGKEARKAAATKPPPPLPKKVVVAEFEKAPPPEENLADILGAVDPYFNIAKKALELKNSISALKKVTESPPAVPDVSFAQVAESLVTPEQQEAVATEMKAIEDAQTEAMMDGCFGDELEAIEQAGSSEMGAFIRKQKVVPVKIYRAAVWQKATKIANGKKPKSKEIFVAEKIVKDRLGKHGIKIIVPGGRPARVTR